MDKSKGDPCGGQSPVFVVFSKRTAWVERVLLPLGQSEPRAACRGPDQVVPEPTEEAPDGVQKAQYLTDQRAVVVLNRRQWAQMGTRT